MNAERVLLSIACLLDYKLENFRTDTRTATLAVAWLLDSDTVHDGGLMLSELDECSFGEPFGLWNRLGPSSR